MPNAERRNLEKKAAAVPEGKRRQRKMTRVGCPCTINCSNADRNNREDKRVKILPSSEFEHSGGCTPCRSQLQMEKRNSGACTVAVNEFHIKSILSVLMTKVKVNNKLLRQLMKPLFPAGTSLDSKLVFNFRLKMQRIIEAGLQDVNSYTVTGEQEMALLNTSALDYEQNPEFLSEALTQFEFLVIQSLMDKNDVAQMTSCLESLKACDEHFDFRIGHAEDGSVSGFVWQTGVMRRDFELCGNVLFVDRVGQSKAIIGWPCSTQLPWWTLRRELVLHRWVCWWLKQLKAALGR